MSSNKVGWFITREKRNGIDGLSIVILATYENSSEL